MANERYGNNYLTCIGKEATYGTSASYDVILPDKCEMKETVATIDIPMKTGVLEKTNYETQAGYKSGTVTISGNLYCASNASSASNEAAFHAIFLNALFDNGGVVSGSYNTFDFPAIGTTPYSYTIYQYFNDDDGHKARGCVLETFDITGSTGGMIEYTATFRAKSVSYEVSVSDAGSDPFSSIPELYPETFSSVSFGYIGGASEISSVNSFSLSISKTFADDAVLFQNNNTKQQEIVTGYEGTFTAEWNYSSSWHEVANDLMSASVRQDVFYLGYMSSPQKPYWRIYTHGKYTDYTLPDPDKGIFKASLSKTLMTEGSDEALQISVWNT